MEKTFSFKRSHLIILGAGVLLFFGTVFIIGRCSADGESDAGRDGRQDVEFGRSMGFVAEFLGELDEGLGGISYGLSSIAEGIGAGSNDLRGYAQTIKETAKAVKGLENDNNMLRDRVRSLLSDLSRYTGDEVNLP